MNVARVLIPSLLVLGGTLAGATQPATAAPSGPGTTSAVVCRYQVQAPNGVAINVRNAPGGGSIVGTLRHGSTVLAYRDIVTNGYRRLTPASPQRWAFADYLKRVNVNCME